MRLSVLRRSCILPPTITSRMVQTLRPLMRMNLPTTFQTTVTQPPRPRHLVITTWHLTLRKPLILPAKHRFIDYQVRSPTIRPTMGDLPMLPCDCQCRLLPVRWSRHLSTNPTHRHKCSHHTFLDQVVRVEVGRQPLEENQHASRLKPGRVAQVSFTLGRTDALDTSSRGPLTNGATQFPRQLSVSCAFTAYGRWSTVPGCHRNAGYFSAR